MGMKMIEATFTDDISGAICNGAKKTFRTHADIRFFLVDVNIKNGFVHMGGNAYRIENYQIKDTTHARP